MNHVYAYARADEPEARLNHHDPADPFVVVDFGNDWRFTSKDPQWCRRVAAAWTTAADLLDAQSGSSNIAGQYPVLPRAVITGQPDRGESPSAEDTHATRGRHVPGT